MADGIAGALEGGLQHLQDLFNQALGQPPPPPPLDAQPADQPGANDTPTPPPEDPGLQDWGYPDDQAPPAPPDTSPPAPAPTPDDQAGPGVPLGGGGGADVSPPAPVDLSGGGGGIGSDAAASGGAGEVTPPPTYTGGGIGSDAAASGGAGAYTPPTWSDYLGNALTGFGNLLVPPAEAANNPNLRVYIYPSQPGDPTSGNPYAAPNTTGATTELPTITGTPEGTYITPPGMGGEEAPNYPVPPITRGEDLPDLTPPTGSPSPVGDYQGPSPDAVFPEFPMPPGLDQLLSNPPTAGDYGGYGGGAAAAAAAAGLIGAGVGGIGGGGGAAPDSGGAGFGPWSANAGGGGGDGSRGTAGDTGEVMRDINPSEFVASGTQTAQNRPPAPAAPRPPFQYPVPPAIAQRYPQIPQERFNHPEQQITPSQQRDIDFLDNNGAHNTGLPMHAPDDGAHFSVGTQSPNYTTISPEFSARLAAAGRAYQERTGNAPIYGETSRGVEVQSHYWDHRAQIGMVAPPTSGSSHERGVAMDIPYRNDPRFNDWLHQNGAEFGLHFPYPPTARNPRGDRPHVEQDPNYRGNPFYNREAPIPPSNVLGGTAPPTGYQYGGQRPMVPQDPSLTEPYGPTAPPPPPTAQERRDAAELARANQEAIRRGLMNPDGTPGPNVLRMPQARPEGAPTTDRYFNPGDFAGVPPTPLPQPRPAEAPSVPYSGGGIGSDAARAPNQGDAYGRDQYFNPGDYQGGPYPSAADNLAAEAARQAQRNLDNYRDQYFNPGDFQGPYPSTADATANDLAAEAARRARAALESGQVPMGYDYGGNRPMMPQEQSPAYDYGGNRPMMPQPPPTEPMGYDYGTSRPVPDRPYDPSMDRPLPGNPYTDPQSMGYDYGPNRPPYPWTRTETSDGTVVDPRKLVGPSKATEETKVPTPPPPKTAPAPKTAPRPAPPPISRPAPRPAPPPQYMRENTPGYASGYSGGGFDIQPGASPYPPTLGSNTRYFVPGSNLVSPYGSRYRYYGGPKGR